MKKLYDAANAALDVVDAEIAQGFQEPEWATQLREAIAEMNAPEPSEDEADWQRFVRMYAEEIGPTPTAEQAMLLKYFKEAGEHLPVDNTPYWFHVAWRKLDVIHTRGCGSKDMIVWHLMHIDTAVDRTLEKFFPPA
ncbi:hypothetical protein IOS36_003958 [Salmonella enterica]|nr:hypothetical protein [Salmonella enterica]EDP9952226.1 hypothetical protein [Salmonella enterica subsp. arizonae]EDX3027067.1 hypothetical protein [Salmonella enterica subsp. houtenae serovar 48:g,z51:-]MBA3158022.1 hypothetical protein [Salmonella enterica subsp. arizonae serovar 48:z4,z24:-]EAU2112910.1 hypothetical protein [Salmonella enterica]